jgi:uncharacterized protein
MAPLQETTMNNPSQTFSNWPNVAAVGFALVFPAVLTWVYFVALAKSAAGVQQATYAVGKTIQFVLPVAWLLAVERGRLPWSWPKMTGVPQGLLFGLAVFAAALAIYHWGLKSTGLLNATGEQVQAKITGFGIRGPMAYLAMAAFYCLIHSFLEEYYWRWFVFGRLESMMPWIAAVAVSSLGFMAHHVILLATYFGWLSPATYVLSVAVAVGGAFWAWLFHHTGSLYGPWLSHLVIDAAIFAVGYDLVRPLFR